MDKPRLLHGKQRVTTDSTLKADLEASLAATTGYRELRADVLTLGAKVDALVEVIGDLAGATVNTVHELAQHQDRLAAHINQCLVVLHRAVQVAAERDQEQIQ